MKKIKFLRNDKLFWQNLNMREFISLTKMFINAGQLIIKQKVFLKPQEYLTISEANHKYKKG